MALINPEIVGLARVSIETDGGTGLATGSYEFVNGFEAGTPTGALPGSPAILQKGGAGSGTYVLYLDEAVDPGKPVTTGPSSPANQGGIKAALDLVQVSTPTNSVPTLQPEYELRWYYGDYDPSASYSGVNPEKAIVVAVYDSAGDLASTASVTFDVVVFKNPTTIYKY